MKKLILSIATLFLAFQVKADEGMWIPMLIGKNIAEMQKVGFKLSADDIYNVNKASMKDAIVHFGGGCTGEIVSPNGLLFTNHHCGYGNIAALSTVDKNYLDDGFWAKSYKEELPAPGLTVKFLVRMEDVTDELNNASESKKAKRKKTTFNDIKAELEKEASEGGKYTAQVSSFFNGNQYFLLVYEVFTDVRLVGTPPKSLGKYGGDTDNWMWPRHTADFSVFRVYANKDNKPAAYSPTNVPYKPKHFLPISIKGVQENDAAMVMGYPGRTNRYETSYGVDMAINEVNPSIVKIRDMRLGVMRDHMRQSPDVRLKLASKYASIANYWKYFIGQTEQLKRLNVIGDKKKQEKEFTTWAKSNNNASADLMERFSKAYVAYRPYAKFMTYYGECFNASALANLAAATSKLYDLLKDNKANGDIQKELDMLKSRRTEMMKSFDFATEQEMLAKTAQLFYKDIPQSQQPDIYQKFIFKQFGSDNWDKTFADFANHVFMYSFLLDDVKFAAFLLNPSRAQLEEDPAVQYAHSFVNNYKKNFFDKYGGFIGTKEALAKQYVRGLMQMKEGQLFYPDANSTMRVTYGSVGGYSPEDAVYYNYFTTMDGLLAKYKAGDEEFDLPNNFLSLAKEKDFGRYADEDGNLVTCFITNDDITGGNSGSPVINGNGELIGLAFDGNWEAMSGDIAFDKKYKRTIVVDSRFVLWLIEKYGGAKNLIDEMDIRK